MLCFRTAFLILLWLPASAFPHQVVSIADGDTLTLLVKRKQIRIRLAGIDAPERGQAYAQQSRQSLASLCWGKQASYEIQDKDRYGRTVATVTCGGVDANQEQVRRGMAWVYRHYQHDWHLLLLEAQARNNRIGLWNDNAPLPPWEFRRGTPAAPGKR